jgi:hypothetical protein
VGGIEFGSGYYEIFASCFIAGCCAGAFLRAISRSLD